MISKLYNTKKGNDDVDPHFCQKCGWIGQGEIRIKLKKICKIKIMFTGTKPGLTHHAKLCKKTGNFQLADLTYFRCEKCGMIILTKRGLGIHQKPGNNKCIAR